MAVLQDVRYAARAVSRRPLYAIVTVFVFAIAIGANTTVFSVLNGFLLRPLPYPDSDQLVMVYDSYPKIGLDNAGTAIPDYLERRAQAPSLEDLAIVMTSGHSLTGEGPSERVLVARSSPSLFSVLRTSPALGRVYTEDEATVGNDRVAVLSHALWSTTYGARSDIVGRDIRLDGETFRVIGVMPPGFGFPNRTIDAWLPFAFTPDQTSDAQRGMQFSTSVGRLRTGATIDALNAELDAIVRRNVQSGVLTLDAIEVAGFTGRAASLRALNVGDLGQMLLLLQATVLAVLLIACANVANLQLTRAAARRKELAVRAALGADARRLVTLVLIESLGLALVGALLGLALAVGGLELVRALGLDPADQGVEFRLDTTVLLVTFGSALVAAFVSALPPVVALLRDDLTRAVHEAGRQAGGGRSTNALRSGLVVVQIGVSVALLIGAGLLTKSFYTLQAEGPGFDASGIFTARFSLPRVRYTSPASWTSFQTRALEGVAALPGVTAAGYTSVLPFTPGNNQGSMVVENFVPSPGVPEPHAQIRSISEGYFASLGVPVIAGRDFSATEAERVAIIDENAAAKLWPNTDALGQRVRHNLDDPDEWYTVIGIVPAMKQGTLAELPQKETIYWHYKQRPAWNGALTLRTTLPPEQLTRSANAVITALDAETPLFDVRPMTDRVLESLGPQRTAMVLTLVFAAVAFALAVVGIYGVLTWAVTQRIGEIGVRLALGAQGTDIVHMVLKQGGRLITLGMAGGVTAAVVLGRVLQSQIRDVSAIDPAVFGIAIAGLATAALLASWLPARRAGRLDPLLALRSE